MIAARVIEIILKECNWVQRYPRIPDITENSSLKWMCAVDRVCAQMALDEEFNMELVSDEFEKADTVADIARLIEHQKGLVT